MNSDLERRYRRILAWYPKAFRADHEEAMLDCLHEAATPSQRWPSLRESASLLAGALRARGRERVGSSSAGEVWGSGLRVGAFLALGVQMALCVQRWNYDWSHQAVFLTDKPQSQLMNLVWLWALVTALPFGLRRRAAAAWVVTVGAWVTVVYSARAQFPSPFFLDGLWQLLPMIAGLLVPAAIITRSRGRLEHHNPWTLPIALTGPVLVALGVVAVGPSTIDAVQVTPYAVLVVMAFALSPFDPRLAVASTVAVLPLALLKLGQELRSLDYSLAALDVTEVLIAIGPLVLLAIVAFDRIRAWERLHAP